MDNESAVENILQGDTLCKKIVQKYFMQNVSHRNIPNESILYKNVSHESISHKNVPNESISYKNVSRETLIKVCSFNTALVKL